MRHSLRSTSLFLLAFLGFGLPSAYSAVFTVTNLSDLTPGSIGEAIFAANASPGADSIRFAVDGVINLNGQLPAIEGEVVIDGTSAPGYVACGAPTVALNYTGGGGAHGLLILAGGAGTTVKALNIRGFTAAAISAEFSSNVTVQSCYIGTDLTGNVAMPNYLGIFLLGSTDCVVGGDECEKNIVCASIANGIALELGSHRTVIAGNYVGLGADGITVLGNGLESIYAYDSDSLKIGLAEPNKGNVILGGATQGIHLNGGGGGSSNALIYNNWIGTNGSTVAGNMFNGVFIEGGTSGTVLGGTDSLQANHIAFNGAHGVLVDSLNNRNTIVGNSIHCNGDDGISLHFANDLIPILPNMSSAANSVLGSGATPGNQVHVYRNVTQSGSNICDCEGEVYLATTIVNAAGNWDVVHGLNLTPAEQASITATQTDALGNTSEFFQPCTATSVGLAVTRLADDLQIFPNPATGVFQVEVGGSFLDAKEVKVLNAWGSLIREYSIDASGPVSINAKAWSRGIYFIQVGGVTRRLVIQ